MEITTDSQTLAPWAEIHRMLANMRSLTVKVGSKAYSGPLTFSSEDGNVVLAIEQAKPKRAKLRVVG